MLGGGAYDEHSKLQAGVFEFAASRLERAVAALTADGSRRPRCIADYGCATGKNSIAVMSRAAELFGAAFEGSPLLLCFCDQPDNDWNVLAARVHEAFGGRDDVAFSMTGRSFYGPVLPTGSVDLAWSTIAVHWLSAARPAGSDALWPHPGLGPERAVFVEQARRDWALFLEQRARELRPGGHMVVVAACSRADGTSSADHYLDVPWEVVRELEAAGELATSERRAMFIPTYFRSAAEYQAPFSDPALPLELLEYTEAPLADVLWDGYERSGDPEAFAAAWVGWLRAFSEPLLAAALDTRRSEANRRSLLDDLYRRIAERVARDPERARVPWTLALVHAVRANR